MHSITAYASQSISDQELWELIFAKNHKYKISWTHNFKTDTDYADDMGGRMGDTEIMVSGDYESIIIKQRNSRTFTFDSDSEWPEAINNIFEIKYSIIKYSIIDVYFANFPGGGRVFL